MKPRVLFVGRSRYRLPLEATQERKWEALAEELDVRVIGTAAPDSSRVRQDSPTSATPSHASPRQATPGDAKSRQLGFSLAPAAQGLLAFYALLPVRIAHELRSFRPDVVVAQSPYEAAAVLVARHLARSHARLLLEVHGDWVTATRLYGSPLRRVLEPFSRRVARFAVRHADAVRTVSPFTSGLVRELGVEPLATFTTFFDVSAFVAEQPAPFPEQPSALFVGVLERYKNVAGLAEAWREVAQQLAQARLRIVGRGREAATVERLVAEHPGHIEWTPSLPATGVAAALDEASLLVLPSFSEGLPRVAMEACCRGRPVVGSRAGGIPDIVEDGVNGLLVPPGDVPALANAIVRVLSDRDLLERLGAGAYASASTWVQTPEQFAQRFSRLVEEMLQ